MTFRTHIPAVAAGLLTCLSSLSVSAQNPPGEIPAPQPSPDTNVSAAAIAVEHAIRQLKDQQQEQQAAASRALELIVNHTETALHRNAVTVSNQLAQFSVALSDYSTRQYLLMRSTENRTLRVTLLILLVVVLTAGALILLAARALRGLANRFSGTAMSYGTEPAPIPPQSMIEPSAESTYSAALLEVEKRIVALEHRQTSAPVPVAAGESSSSPSATPQASARAASPRFRSAPVSLAIGSGEALVFLPRDQATPLPNDSRLAAALGRIGRLFHKTAPRPGIKPFKG